MWMQRAVWVTKRFSVMDWRSLSLFLSPSVFLLPASLCLQKQEVRSYAVQSRGVQRRAWRWRWGAGWLVRPAGSPRTAAWTATAPRESKEKRLRFWGHSFICYWEQFVLDLINHIRLHPSSSLLHGTTTLFTISKTVPFSSVIACVSYSVSVSSSLVWGFLRMPSSVTSWMVSAQPSWLDDRHWLLHLWVRTRQTLIQYTQNIFLEIAYSCLSLIYCQLYLLTSIY